MNTTNSLRNALLISIAVVLAMIILVMLLSIGEATATKRTVTFIIVLGPIGFLILLWMRTFRLLKTGTGIPVTDATESDIDEDTVIAHTGNTCEIPGTYQCTEHEKRQLSMVPGKRFPPCHGEGKGHSADWILVEKN